MGDVSGKVSSEEFSEEFSEVMSKPSLPNASFERREGTPNLTSPPTGTY